ncbi:hypothetical protein [Catenulispora sp. GP43]|uniref:hypothetical protein n=1 Tax=Catenulispora sp. GP43 TaxID=3156263 RepID=UPI0035136729
MDTNHGAGDPPDDDVFGPVEDGEEVFEWIDDQDGARQPDDQRAKPPSRTFRERLAAVRAGGRSLRGSRREIAAVTAAIVLACAVGGACTAWFDSVAGAADRADVVALAVDSVVDGDPAASSYQAADTSAVGQYIVEIANNSPDAVTLTSVDVDAGTLMTSSAWKPAGGSARIPAGGTARVALTVRLSCPLVILSQQTGMFADAPGTGGGTSLAFPAVHVQVRDSDGDPHSMVLATRVDTSAQLATGQQAFRSPGGATIPGIISADAGPCTQYAADRIAQRVSDDAGAARFPSDVVFGYDKVLSSSTDSFVLGFTVKNNSDRTVTLTSRGDTTYIDDPQLRTEWLPAVTKLAPGQSQPGRLTVNIHDCTSVLSDAPVLGETMMEVDDGSGGPPQPVFIDQALTGSLRMAGDVVNQEKAACG